MKELIKKILIEEVTSNTSNEIDTAVYTSGKVPTVIRLLPKGWTIYGWEDVNNINKDTKYHDKLIISKNGYIAAKWIDGKGDDKEWNKWLISEYFWESRWLMKLLESWQIASKKTPDELIYVNKKINEAYKNKDIDFSGNAFGLTQVEDKTDKYNNHLKIQAAFDELHNQL